MQQDMSRAIPPFLLVVVLVGCGDESPADADAGMGTEPDAVGFDVGDTDMADYACVDPAWVPAACAEGVVTEVDGDNGIHIDEPDVITYEDVPPAAGPHRGMWGAWGEYEFMPPQRYIHNLEHGGVVMLYHPCAASEVVDQLRAYAQGRPDDDGGAFRWILTPYPDLPSTVAVAVWGKVYSSHCVDVDEITDFVDQNYRTAPEDVGRDGTYGRLWLGR